MATLYYTEEHEWLAVEGNIATVGITDFAQQQLGDIVFVDLPEPGKEIEQGDEVVVIESVKAAGEIKSPVAGTVVAINEALADTPETVNEDPMGDGWFLKLHISNDIDLGKLLDEAGHQGLLEDS
ncbi:glycine cleavage system protein H [Kineobactrum sediminis]|uniref:Glycine cleavage system H protein n=1 Tax=Kineobactrum sediminis TaxID=1905677 RepID=A0A2N5XZ52_9GAMM|nr:glycine cleavage system protein GcvH [Kineobactrum sediminis]PLW81417.1 glycine cleavage system protein H [Kineobactrum sediminis]